MSHKKILKSTATKKVIAYFYNFGENKKVAASVIFPASIYFFFFFEVHQRFKGHFLNKLRVPLTDADTTDNFSGNSTIKNNR